MKIVNVKIQNFRKLVDIEFKCTATINTIVGPNGVGKSSIIDAIRLTKSVLLPSYDNEANSTLQFMGIFSPQYNSVLFKTICNDINKKTKIDISIELSKEKKDIIKHCCPTKI